MSASCAYCRRKLNDGDVAYLQKQRRIKVDGTTVISEDVPVVVCEPCATGGER